MKYSFCATPFSSKYWRSSTALKYLSAVPNKVPTIPPIAALTTLPLTLTLILEVLFSSTSKLNGTVLPKEIFSPSKFTPNN
ncbi:MAG: hypothetical protein GAK29_04863 [Acinetobacter bereziniae]|uniref:Uncharacterized protein n=1 Tax=Acinetobacter bereziniae TaxID=106648 RepID=A0A833UQG0_ACIBZ|nr:MAG: hypothetical protein GAK29_04863 [Acinetobacter bereziniae]